ncbi:MAG: heme biosynthesis HemY N-terminal domain-containing protein [Acidiferrobacter sp.]
MKVLSVIVILLLASVSLTLVALHNPGYVLIERTPWSIEMPLTLFVLLLFATVGILYFIVHATARLLHIPRDVGRFRLNRRTRHVQRALTQGLIRLVEGDYGSAEKELVGDLKTDRIPGIHYLAAACAAQGQQHYERRDEHLTHAQAFPELSLATGLLQARLYAAGPEQERALATLAALRIAHPGNRSVLRALARQAQAMKDWTTLAHLAPALRRYKALEPATIDTLELEAHRELLTIMAHSDDENVTAAFRALPKYLREHPALLAIHVRGLIGRQAMEEAESLLLAALRHEPDDGLFAVYGELRGNDPLRLLAQAEPWLARSPSSGPLLLTLAKLATRAQLPGKAREYAERCLRHNPTVDTYAQLVAVMEALGEDARAREYCQRGLELQKSRDNGRGGRGAPHRP